jgi:large subunit ribosomal protein L3
VTAIIGKKLGMTQVFTEDGIVVPVTVIEAGPCPVTAVREPERDGYAAVQLAYDEVVTVEAFEPGQKVKISGISVGKGFQGTIKRHRFSRGPMSHGSHNIRAPGSIGASADPSRVFRGLRMPGQMGAKRATQRGLEVVQVDAERNLLLIKGSVPGSRNRIVEVRSE